MSNHCCIHTGHSMSYKIAIMQPYFFPYIGYFQLLDKVDHLVLLDDVSFIRRGWINRNTIILGGVPHRITLPLCKVSQNKKICEIKLIEGDKVSDNIPITLYHAYHKAPFYGDVIENILFPLVFNRAGNLVDLLENTLRSTSEYIGQRLNISRSSAVRLPNNLKGQEKIIRLCEFFGASTYLNPVGGRNLYEKKVFEDRSIELKFLQSVPNKYPQQGTSEFIPNMSILDLCFNLPKSSLKRHRRAGCLMD